MGLELLWAAGPDILQRIGSHGSVFADAKLDDIPNTVERALGQHRAPRRADARRDALGGEAMMRAAGRRRPRRDRSGSAGSARHRRHGVVQPVGRGLASAASLAFEAKSSGLDGVVVSGEDVQDVRAVCGDEFCLVVPGILRRAATGTIRSAC